MSEPFGTWLRSQNSPGSPDEDKELHYIFFVIGICYSVVLAIGAAGVLLQYLGIIGKP